VPNVPKTIGDGPINATPSKKEKKKKKCEHTHEPINMNHNMLFKYGSHYMAHIYGEEVRNT